MPACFIVLQLRFDSCEIHGYVMLCYKTFGIYYKHTLHLLLTHSCKQELNPEIKMPL